MRTADEISKIPIKCLSHDKEQTEFSYFSSKTAVSLSSIRVSMVAVKCLQIELRI